MGRGGDRGAGLVGEVLIVQSEGLSLNRQHTCERLRWEGAGVCNPSAGDRDRRIWPKSAGNVFNESPVSKSNVE